jgi:peptidyl-prolyl cis-trans isomerase SurA
MMAAKIVCKQRGRLLLVLCYIIIFNCMVPTVWAWAEDPVVVDRIVAVVNDDIITLFDLKQSFEPYAKNIKAMGYSSEKEREVLFKVRSDLLDQLIDRKLVDFQIKKNNIMVIDKEIDNAIERIKAARYYTDEDLRAGLAQQGLTMEEYRKELKEQLLRSRLVNLEVKSKIVVTKEDIQSYYEKHREKYAGEKKYHLWNIFMKISAAADDSERRSDLTKMETILAKVKQGKSFESLAKDDFIASLGASGGDLGLFLLNELSTQLQKVVAEMKAGEVSDVLTTDFGYQILYLQRIIETPAKSLAEVENEIHDLIYKEAVDNKYQVWLEELRKQSNIKIIN